MIHYGFNEEIWRGDEIRAEEGVNRAFILNMGTVGALQFIFLSPSVPCRSSTLLSRSLNAFGIRNTDKDGIVM